PQIDLAGASVERRDAERPGVEFACDHGLMQQALVNLLRNAAEALAEMPAESRPRRPRIAVDAQRVKVREPGGVREMVSLIVEDNGPGVPEAVRARMFNPFFTTRHTGTGLGLAIVHRIVDAHGGRVRVRDAAPRRANAGAVVEILLPDGAHATGNGTNETERSE